MVLLDQHRVVQAGPVIGAAPRRDGRLLQAPQPRRRLARIEDLHPGPLDHAHAARRHRRHPREPLEEVQSGPLAGEDRPGKTLDPRHGALFAPDPFVDEPLELDVRIQLAEHRLRHLQAEHHPRRLLTDQGPSARVLQDRRLGRHVAIADVLRECADDRISDHLHIHGEARIRVAARGTVARGVRPLIACAADAGS